MTIVVLTVLSLVTLGIIIGCIREFPEASWGIRIYYIIGIMAGLALSIGGFVSYFTHWF